MGSIPSLCALHTKLNITKNFISNLSVKIDYLNGQLSERLGGGLQNRLDRFDSCIAFNEIEILYVVKYLVRDE